MAPALSDPGAAAAKLLLEQCKYIYGDTLPDTAQGVAGFNSRFGGVEPQTKNATRVLCEREQ